MYLNRLRMTRKPAETAAFLSQAIMTLPMCADATDQILQRLVEACEPCRLQPREVAVRMGQRNDYFFMLQAGRITITKGDSISSSSKEEALNPGNTFGQEALARGAPADFTAIAGGGCLLWRLHRTAFKLLQMDSGVRMRNAIGNVLDARRQGRFGGQVGQPSALQLIVLQAQERKRLEANAQDRQQEFSDVQDALQDALSPFRAQQPLKGLFELLEVSIPPVSVKPWQVALGPAPLASAILIILILVSATQVSERHGAGAYVPVTHPDCPAEVVTGDSPLRLPPCPAAPPSLSWSLPAFRNCHWRKRVPAIMYKAVRGKRNGGIRG